MIRTLLADDAELRELRAEARQRHLRLAVAQLPLSVCAADFTEEAMARFERTDAPRWTAGVTNPWAAWLLQNIRRRIAELLAGVFGPLRAGELAATGILAATGARTCVPADTWASTPAVALDMRTSGLLVGGVPVFLAVKVDAPAAPAPLSEAAARRFIERFTSHMAACGRTFSSGEATEALQRAYPGAPMTTGKQAHRLLRELRPGAWANGGRRARFQIPSATELTAAGEAARQAAESHP